MARAKLTKKPIDRLGEESENAETILNYFDPQNPVEIRIATDVWEATYDGVCHRLGWQTLKLPEDVISSLKAVARERLKTNAPSDLKEIRLAVTILSDVWKSSWVDFGDVGVDNWYEIWSTVRPSARVFLRSIYTQLAEADLSGADLFIADELAQWKARNNVRHLGYVLDWHPVRGALTTSECELLRRAITCTKERETDEDKCVRVLTWTVIETLKRPRQLLLVSLDGLKQITDGNNTEYFLTVPKVKRQRGEDAEWWPISKELGSAISDLKQKPAFANLRSAHNRLFLWNSEALSKNGEIPSWEVRYKVAQLIRSYEIYSERTKDWLHVTPNRIRHTGATTLAMQGVSRNMIQYILEHSSPQSANAYVDAVGSNLLSAIDRADRKMGNIFAELSKCFFKGRIVTNIVSRPIHIPQLTPGLALVGGCGRDERKEGICPKHPFFACYNGCSNFLAWKAADHKAAQRFIENRLDTWNAAAGGPAKSKTIQEYERTHKAISEVIKEIAEDDRPES